mmetsp:Transcript_57446/g.94991  ORF Transcript_57446/g.94991 Transcript_57446/m.94991 type:complete len:96 (-) Transcript_57446:737-1024(-)
MEGGMEGSIERNNGQGAQPMHCTNSTHLWDQGSVCHSHQNEHGAAGGTAAALSGGCDGGLRGNGGDTLERSVGHIQPPTPHGKPFVSHMLLLASK